MLAHDTFKPQELGRILYTHIPVLGVNHLSVPNPVFWEKYINMSSAEIFTQSFKIYNQVNYYW